MQLERFVLAEKFTFLFVGWMPFAFCCNGQSTPPLASHTETRYEGGLAWAKLGPFQAVAVHVSWCWVDTAMNFQGFPHRAFLHS